MRIDKQNHGWRADIIVMAMRRFVFAAATAATLIGGSVAAQTPPSTPKQDYPNRPLRMVVPYSAGSASDVMARVVGEKLGTLLGQPVVIDLRPGANGTIGTNVAAAAAPDGYTFVLLGDATAALSPALIPNLSYDVRRDFAPLSYAGDVRMVLVVSPELTVKSIADLVAMARTRKGEMDYASGGNGSIQQVLMEIFMDAAGVRMTHVPFKGVSPAVVAVVGGQVPVMIAGAAGVLPQIKAGRLRALAVTSAERQPALPDVPTMTEAGIGGFPAEPWNAFFAPAKTPAPILERLSAALALALNSPDVREKLASQLTVKSSTPDELRKILDRDIARYDSLVKKVGMKAD